ncbi:MAG: site-specific DNA-methyltransferase [Thermoguttaceae bacterium]|nr:site-specific DNA-methyltransferase [Thermoguttaceae bacterium]
MPQKLELTWYGKDEPMQIEPRLLIENAELSNCKPKSKTENMLIHGDNLLALKALESQYAGKVKCIYIDPPYNTGSAFEHYDDNLEHSIWLGLMKRRLEFLSCLLCDDGFICCHINDDESAYLKVLMDEVFGRGNYLTTFFIQVRYPEKTLKQDMAFHKEIEQIHIYRKRFGAVPNQKKVYKSLDKYCYYFVEKGSGREITLGGKKTIVFSEDEYEIIQREGSSDGRKEIWASGTILDGNSSGRFFRDYLTGRVAEDGLGVLYKVYGIGDDKFDFRYFTGPKKAGATKGKYYQGVPLTVLETPDSGQSVPIENFYDLAANFGNCRQEGGVEFRSGKKPERLLQTIIEFFSNPGDLVLDSFLGSGTTAAVAHKMGRRWIGIEMGDHAYSHCKVRLDKVISGEDNGGITKDVQWQGGGEYRFFELAPSLINYDLMDQPIFNREYNAEMLAAAVALHEGYKYQPDDKVFWKQSVSNEKSWLFVTTRHVTVDFLSTIVSTMNEGEYLFVAARSFDSAAERAYKQITVKKIPEMLLKRCKFGKKDYNLNIVHPPVYEDEDEE